jgi:pimeloyl-ACP methyl ester carboxylesterase
MVPPMSLPRLRGLLLGASFFSVCACARLLPAPVPMRSVKYELSGAKARCLLILLPGAGDSAEDFERNGFVAELRARPLAIDIVAANATMGYYFRGTMVDRLSTDVLGPNLARGYEQVWALGVSMGGFGTFLYSLERPSELAGIFAIAPYLGDASLIKEIRDAGGLAKWRAPAPAPVTEDNYQRQLWRWLQAQVSGAEKGPDFYLAYGADDRKVGDGDALLAAALPPEHRRTVPGGHDWPYWRLLLREFLDHSAFARNCAASAR